MPRPKAPPPTPPGLQAEQKPGGRVNLVGGCLVVDDVKVATDRDFDVLFRDLYPRLVAVGVGMLGDVELARDLAQETMARGHRNWTAVAAADSPEAWLRRVMVNLVIDQLRRRRVETRALEQVAAAPATSADDPAGEHGGDVPMAQMLGVLSERQRAVITLFYVDDLPIASIAKVLGIAPGTVKALLWKARRTLMHHLDKEDRE